MGLDLNLVIVDPERQVVIFDRWLGRRSTLDAFLACRSNPAPSFVRDRESSWGSITDREAHALIDASYLADDDRASLRRLLVDHPPDRYWWMLRADE